MRVKTTELELSEEIGSVWGAERYNKIRILVRDCGRPIGWAWLNNDSRASFIPAELIREAVFVQLGGEVVSALILRRLAIKPADLSLPISVVVCTRDRATQLAACIESLLSQDHTQYEVIIVDNAPSNDQTARLAARFSVRYVREDRPGLDWARNRGIAEARHSIVAFTDDDVRVDRRWLQAISGAFNDPCVMGVNGLVAAAELETDAQLCFERYGGMSHGLRRRIIRKETSSVRELLWASSFGVGANMAFRREVFDSVGGFDVALDVGTPSGGCGDVEMFHRVVASAHIIVYEPSALVWHTHRRDFPSLRQQIYDNGRGFGSYLLTCLRNATVARTRIIEFALRDHLGWLLRRIVRSKGVPRGLYLRQLSGLLLSPWYYSSAQRRARELSATRHIAKP